MSYAFSVIKGLTFYNRAKAYTGVILLVPADSPGIWLIDMMGSIIHYWQTNYTPIHAELLPNGNLLYMGRDNNSPLADFEGFGGNIEEIDWEGKVVWHYQEPYLHHAPYRTKEGNTLALRWVKVPGEIAAKVQGGDAGTEREGVMWGDAIREITPGGEVIWEWTGHEHLDPAIDISCPICPRSEWTHATAVVELPDGNILASFMETNTLATIDKKSGDIIWRWGGPEGELAHQHSPKILDNGNILVFDNGLHPPGMAKGSSRILEIKPGNGKMVWSFGGWLEQYFYSSTMGNCQKLPNENIFVCESNRGRLFELSPEGALVWEFVNYLPSYETIPSKSGSCPVFSAYRYGVDYSGLKRPGEQHEHKYEAAPGTKDKGEAAISSRLERLGY